ncbi:MAG: protein kinase [Vicinamibacterales bacterium]
MDPGRWARMKEIFQAARECEPAEREALLRELCGNDDALNAAVEAMLAREHDAAGFLESPALNVEAEALAREPARGSETSEPTRLAPPQAHSPKQALRPTWWIVALALVFLADLLLKTWGLVLGPVGFGITSRVEKGEQVITAIVPGSLAELAGMRVGDVLVTLDGRPVAELRSGRVRRPNLEIGRVYRFQIERNGQRWQASIEMPGARLLRTLNDLVVLLWQVAAASLLATAVLIAFVRPKDPVALTGALTLASLSSALWLFNLPPGYAAALRNAPLGLGVLLWIPNFCVALAGPIGLSFFTRFPRPLFQARWVWIPLWLPALMLLPFQLYSLFLVLYLPDLADGRRIPWVYPATAALFAAYGLAMLAAIGANFARLTDQNERRRLRLLVAGGAAGTLPALLRLGVFGLAPEESALRKFLMSGVPNVFITLVFLLFPVSFAYAVLKHRLLGMRVIVRMGLQYALTRGLVLSLVPLLGVILVGDALVHGDQPLQQILAARGWIYALLGAIALAVHTQRHRWSAAIDRRFFREEYNARHLLRDVAERARRAGSLQRAGPGVVARIEAALHPEYAALMFRPSGGASFTCIASAPAGQDPPAIAEAGRLVARLRAAAGPVESAGEDAEWSHNWPSGVQADEARPPRLHLFLPIAMGAGRHEAMLALGPKRSEEPYSDDDLEMLEAAASNLALLLDAPTPAPDRLSSEFEECPTCGTCYDTGAARCANEQARLQPIGMPRTLAARYRLERRLGRGGMGTVYSAVDVALDRPVAVKVVRDEWVHNTLATQRFRREARAVAGFAHPNVVTVYDFGVETGSRAFLVMELLSGATLREELRRSGRLSPARTLDVLRGVCSAVGAAHERGFIHRDLKPENIFLVDGGGPVKVLDFGVAKPLVRVEAADVGGAPETEVGVLVGTVGYISPEQLLGDRPDVSWDVWALTVVAYESLTAALPFPVESRDAWRQHVMAGRHRPLSDHLADPPAPWQAFFDAAFAIDQARRPRSAAEFLRRLERALV